MAAAAGVAPIFAHKGLLDVSSISLGPPPVPLEERPLPEVCSAALMHLNTLSLLLLLHYHLDCSHPNKWSVLQPSRKTKEAD